MTGEELRSAREARRLSVPELARLAGVSSDTIRRIEGGTFSGRARTIRSLETALGGTQAQGIAGHLSDGARAALEHLLDRYGEPMAAYLLAHAEHFRGFGPANDAALVGAR